MSLEDEITGRKFTFSQVNGYVLGTITLLPKGAVGGYQNPNERAWSVEDGKLVFRNGSGVVTTVFGEADRKNGAYVFRGAFVSLGPAPWHVLAEVTGAPTAPPRPGAPPSPSAPTSPGKTAPPGPGKHDLKYDLSHLTQRPNQAVSGPIQDDEALFLFALIRVMLVRRVLEIGGLSGYSATNFTKAVGPLGVVYTIDIRPVPKVAENHFPMTMDARTITAETIGNVPLDLIFFDCHDLRVQMEMLSRLQAEGMITDRTLLALHDTNLHPTQTVPWAKKIEGGWVHQPVERRMVNEIRKLGYDAISLDTDPRAHGPDLPFRHGLTIMRKFTFLAT